VDFLSITGDSSTCWHAAAFQAAMDNVPDDLPTLRKYLPLGQDVTISYAVDIATERGAAAVAFDGAIYAPVVATKRSDITCIAVECRSTQRQCQHTKLVQALERLASVNGEDIWSALSDEDGSEDDGRGHNGSDDDGDVDLDDEEHVSIRLERQQRNLISFLSEDEQSRKWARSAEWAADPTISAICFAPAM